MLAKVDIKTVVLRAMTQAHRITVKSFGYFPSASLKTELALVLNLAHLGATSIL